MLAALTLLAAIAIGPEQTLPATTTVPECAVRAAVAPAGDDFFVAWRSPNVVAQRIGRATTTGTFIATAAASPTPAAIAIASNGSGALVAWGDDGLHVALLDDDAHVLRTRTIAPEAYAVAVVPAGNRYLVVWATIVNVKAAFVDPITGAPDGFPFLVASVAYAQVAIASNGTNALVVFGGRDLRAVTIDVNGKVSATSAINGLLYGRPAVTWDGSAYVIAWLRTDTGSAYVAAVDRNGTTTRGAQPVGSANRLALAASANGSTLFFNNDSKGALHTVRFAAGGVPLDATPQASSLNLLVDDAAFNGSRTFVVSSSGNLRGAFVETGSVTPLAFRAPPQATPAIAAGDSLLWLGWTDAGDAHAARVIDGTILKEDLPLGSGTLGMTAQHDRAVAVTVGNPLTSARTIDADGRVFAPIDLDFVWIGPPESRWIDTIAPLVDGVFIVSFTRFRPGPEILSDLWYQAMVTFGSGPIAEQQTWSYRIPRAATTGILAWYDDRIRVSAITPLLLTDEKPVTIDDRSFEPLAIATDGANHVLLATNHNVYAVDLASRTAVRRDDVNGNMPHIAWDGEQFIVVTDDLTISMYSPDGQRLARSMLATPTPPHDVAIASGPAGTAIVYLRNASDLGFGDADRVMLRMITQAPPRHHAARH